MVGVFIFRPGRRRKDCKKMIAKSDRLTHVHSDIRGPLYVEALQMQTVCAPPW